MSRNVAYIVGTGPGSPAYITTAAEKAIKEASIIVGWDFNLVPAKSLIDGKKIFLQDAGNYIEVARKAADEARENKAPVAVLRIGDPCLSGGLNAILRIFADFEIKIIPGVSSTQFAAAAARINLDESVIISFHEDHNLAELEKFMLDAFAQKRHLIVVTGRRKPGETARFLMDNGISENTPALVCENLTLDNEKIFQGTLKDIVLREFSWLSVMVVKQGAHKYSNREGGV